VTTSSKILSVLIIKKKRKRKREKIKPITMVNNKIYTFYYEFGKILTFSR
jgi:hypothetical protein